jgi:hypothetical protein
MQHNLRDTSSNGRKKSGTDDAVAVVAIFIGWAK